MDMIIFTDGLMLIECTVLTFLLKISYFLFRHPDLFPIHCSPPCRFDCYLKANALAEKWDKIPIVLAGDFNSTPDVCFYFLLTYMVRTKLCAASILLCNSNVNTLIFISDML